MPSSYQSTTPPAGIIPFDNTSNSFVAAEVQSAIEESRYALGFPQTDLEIWVSKSGNDTTGNGTFGRPFLTIGKAQTQIGVYADAGPTKRYTIHVGPGDYNENLSLIANVFVKGNGPLSTRLTGTTLNVNNTTWNVTSADNRSGFMDMAVNPTCTFDFSAQANATDGKLYFWNVRTSGAWTCTANTNITQIVVQDTQFFGAITCIGCNTLLLACTTTSVTVQSGTTSGQGAATMALAGGRNTGNITATWTANGAVTLNLIGLVPSTTTTLTASGSSCTVNSSADSLPVPANRTFSSSAVLVRINDNFARGLLSATTNVDASASTAPTINQYLRASNSTTAAWSNILGISTVHYGDGSDGALSISSGTTTLTRDMYYSSITVTGTAQINPNGKKIYCSGACANGGSNGIILPPNVGSNGSGQTGGTGAIATASGNMGNGLAGQNGSNGAAGGLGGSSGVPGTNAGTSSGYGAAGAAGGNGGSGTGGTAGTYTNLPERIVRHDHLVALAYKNGGQGGASGGGGSAAALATGGGGGGGGSGGGVIMIFARSFNNTATVGVSARGGAGGNGGNAPSGNATGGGGGAGGGGGHIYIVCDVLTAVGTLTVTGGAGGTGGTGNGGGSAGTTGGTGSTGHTTIYTSSTDTWTVT